MTKLFQPNQRQIRNSNLYRFESYLTKNFKKKFKNYFELWNWTVKNPSNFWQSIAKFFEIPLQVKKKCKSNQDQFDFLEN